MIKKFLYRIFCGFFLGLGVLAPGFSSSMMAIAMGIYQDVINIIANPFKKFKENVIYCIPLGIGVLISGILFVLVFNFLFETYEKTTYFFLVGLIAGSLLLVTKQVKKHKIKTKSVIGGILALVFAITVIMFSGLGAVADGETGAAALWLLIIGGFLGGVVFIIPGMSGAMILIVLGIYHQMIYMINETLNLNLDYLVSIGIFAIAMLVGIVLTSKGIKYVFDKFPAVAHTAVFGFMLGSLIGIFIQTLNIVDINFNWLFGILSMILGLGVSLFFVFMDDKIN